MQNINFIKMHGAGNDFVIIDCRRENFTPTSSNIQKICDRHKGVGCDQLVIIKQSDKAFAKVEFYNSDGSISASCGNASRCVAHLLMKDTNTTKIAIETKANILNCEKLSNGQYKVNMGIAKFAWNEIPLAQEADTLQLDLLLRGHETALFSSYFSFCSFIENFCNGATLKKFYIKFKRKNPLKKVQFHVPEVISLDKNTPFALQQNPKATCVSMGNPHAVFFLDDIENIDLNKYGPLLEHHKLFPQRANIGIAQIVTKNEIKLRVWERGSGETLACGSGACAAVVAGIRRGELAKDVLVRLKGGDLNIEVAQNWEVFMSGPAEEVFLGSLNYK